MDSSNGTPQDDFSKLGRNNKRRELSRISEHCTPKASIEFSIELKNVLNERNILTTKTRKRVFEALDEIKTQSEDESRHYKREKALLEIVNSEKKYVQQLETIIDYFLKPAEERKLLKSDDFQSVFGHIMTIYNINKELLQELDKGEKFVASAFCNIALYFKLYSAYAFDFKHILSILQNARALNPQFAKFVENQETRPEVQNKLSALLITPIQRIPRYRLLLQQLYELTKPNESDYDKLKECLQKIESVAEHVNKIVDDQENMQRLLELQRCLRGGEPSIIKPGRKLLKEGVLTKMTTKKCHSQKLYTVLMSDIIIFSKMKKDDLAVNSLKCLSIFPLSKCRVIEVADKGCLRIVCQDEELILYHEQYSETRAWFDAIFDSIENYLSDRKTLRKDSSSRRPVKRKDLHEYHEVGLSPGRPMKKRRMENEFETGIPKISRRKPINNLLNSINEFETKEIPRPETISSHQQVGIRSSQILNCCASNITTNYTPKEEQKANEENAPMSKELFVFGKQQGESAFRFSKILGGVGATFKRIFGFKN